MLYASDAQVTAIAPSWLADPTTQVQVEYQGVQSDPFPMSVHATAPGVFTQDSSGNGPAAALNQDYSPNSPANPAPAGTAVLLYATGAGRANPVVSDGSVVSAAALPVPVLPVSVTIGGQPAQVLYAGGAPGMVNGLLQVNVQIPAGIAAGLVPVTLTIGDQTAQQTITISVQ
jgi:uncharacterized protein (TIGR03437 family)